MKTNKRTIRLNENTLRGIIRESVNKVLNEVYFEDDGAVFYQKPNEDGGFDTQEPMSLSNKEIEDYLANNKRVRYNCNYRNSWEDKDEHGRPFEQQYLIKIEKFYDEMKRWINKCNVDYYTKNQALSRLSRIKDVLPYKYDDSVVK